VGLVLERGSFKALLTGDSEQSEIGAWLAAGVIPDVNVLKAAQHGGQNAVTAAWLDQSRPEVVIVSVGPNPWGLPSQSALSLYQSAGRRLYRTDLNGDVLVAVDSTGSYRVLTERPQLSR
jgi:competence protein ComEC